MIWKNYLIGINPEDIPISKLLNNHISIILCNFVTLDFQNEGLIDYININCEFYYINKIENSILLFFIGETEQALETALWMQAYFNNIQIPDSAISIHTNYFLSPDDLFNSLAICSLINQSSVKYGLSIGVSQNTFTYLNNPNKYNYRFTDKIDSIAIFDFIDGEREQNKNMKIESKSVFEDSVFNFYRNRYAEASAGFNNTLLLYPGDKASISYLRRSEEALKAGKE